MYNQAVQTYQRNNQQTADPRSLEAQVLVKAALKLEDIQSRWADIKMPSAELEEALTYNRKLWTVISSGVTREENPLPPQLKANIISIANFVFKHSISVLIDPQAERLNTLISINKNMAEGLRGNG